MEHMEELDPPLKKIKRADLERIDLSLVWKTCVISRTPPITITGYSKSTEKTFFHVPALKSMLDAGSCKRNCQPDFCFLTHTHDDHVKGLPYICTKEGGVTIYCPEEAVPFLENYVRSQMCLNFCTNLDPSTFQWKLVGVRGGDQFYFGKNNHRVTVVECIHGIPCVGFCFDEKRKRLKEEYKGLTGTQLGVLRKEGKQLQEDWYKPLFVYLGDTHIDVFKKNNMLTTYPIIIVECTFLYDDPEVVARANANGHIHWNDLKNVILENPQVTFVLIHFSLRYSEKNIFEFFDGLLNRKENPLNLDNVVIFAGE